MIRYFALLIFLVYSSSNVGAQTVLRQPVYPSVNGDQRINEILIGSRWGFIPAINAALSETVKKCANTRSDEISAVLDLGPHRFGRASLDALAALRECTSLLDGVPISNNEISEATFKIIAPGRSIPTVLEKAKTIAFAGAGRNASDYDRAFWNVDAPKSAGEAPREVFTWGPGKATVVDGCFVQKIIREIGVSEEGRRILELAFNEDPESLSLLNKGPCTSTGAEFIDIYNNLERKDGFLRSFVKLGESNIVRQVYDNTYLGEGGPWSNRIANYHRLYKEAGIEPTEIDFAFFLELARGTPLPTSKLAERARQIKASSPTSAAEARRRWVEIMSFKSEGSRQFATGRFVSYYIDSIGESSLNKNEINSWRNHSRVRASDVGLTENKLNPCEILPSLDTCS